MMRLGQIARKLNVEITVITESLSKKGFIVENNPNSKINMHQVAMLNKEFKTSALDKEEASHLSIGKRYDPIQTKENLVSVEIFREALVPANLRKPSLMLKSPHKDTIVSKTETIEVPSGYLENLFPEEWKELKIGKVKFYDASKGFGYVFSFSDEKDCFIHSSKLKAPTITENDVVAFNTVDSRKKPGELDAINVLDLIPTYSVKILVSI